MFSSFFVTTCRLSYELFVNQLTYQDYHPRHVRNFGSHNGFYYAHSLMTNTDELYMFEHSNKAYAVEGDDRLNSFKR